MVKMYVQTPLKFWFHIKFSREYDYVNEYPYSAKLQNMTCWTESGTQSSHIKGLDKCVWCWVCSVLSKQRGEVVWWARGVRFTKANCGQESQWPYTDCGPAVTGMFASCRLVPFVQSWQVFDVKWYGHKRQTWDQLNYNPCTLGVTAANITLYRPGIYRLFSWYLWFNALTVFMISLV